MSSPQPPVPTGRRRRVAGRAFGAVLLPLACTAALTLGAGLPAASAAAAAPAPDRNHGPADPSWPPTPAKAGGGGTSATVAAAKATAKSTGRPVQIDALTTPTGTTTANPDGTLSTTSAPVVEHVKNADGTWRAVDATLRANPDGTVTPVAVPSALAFSGGGKGPMATMTTADGKKLALKAPFDLPKPELDGAGALYRSVLPDVDLRLSATTAGGWRQVLIVRTVTAAANPEVRKLRLDVLGDGLTVKADAHGNLTAEDAAGTPRFTAPVPAMWDSTPAPADTAAPPAPRTRGKSAEAPPPDSASAPVPSGPEGPGNHARRASIATVVNGAGIELTPDPALLGQGTGPWFIDPGWNPSVDNGSQAWAQVQEGWPETMEYNGTVYDQDKPAAGYCDFVQPSPCERKGRERAYFQIGLNPQFRDATVLSAKLYANVVASSSPGTPTPMNLYSTGTANSNPINRWTRWNAQPCQDVPIQKACGKVTTTWMKGTGGIEFDVAGVMAQAAREHWDGWTFAFAPDDETYSAYRQRFANNPHISVTYDFQPHVGSPQVSPTPGFAANSDYRYQCQSPDNLYPWTNPGWIGVNSNINLSSDTWSPTGEQLWTAFSIWDDDDGGATKIHEVSWNNSGRVGVDVGPLTDGHQYGWFARTGDGTLDSANGPMCYLRIDRTPPTARITSTDFPESGTLGGHPKMTGQQGTFTLTGTDPIPAGGARSSGLACARWTNDPVKASATGWTCNDGGNIVKMDGNGNYQLPYTAWRWGTNFLYLQVQDNAGNMSQPVAYTFYVPHNPAGPDPVYGDLDSDGNPDLLLPDSTGSLRLTGAGADPHASPNAVKSSAPGGNGWGQVDITHRGSFSNRNYDDLIAHRPGDASASLYANDGIVGRFDGQAPVSLHKPVDCALPDADGTTITCSDYGYGPDWSSVTQIAAFGSPEGDTPTTLASGLKGLPATSLLFVDNGRLWLARSDGGKQLGTAVLLSQNNQDWSHYDLIAPGPAKGTDTPTLWARSKNDSTIHAYAFKKNGSAFDTTAFADPTQGWIAGGVDRSLYPKVGSSGDITGDGIPDLWAVDTNQQLVAFPGTGAKASGADRSGPTVTGLEQAPAVLGNLNRPVANWLASPNGSNTVTDGQGKADGTASGVSWGWDNVGGRGTTVAQFSPGAGSNITTQGPVVDTRKSFTVSTWVKSGPAGGVVAGQTADHASDFIIYNDGGTGPWRFAMSWRDTGEGWPFHYTSTVNANATSRVGVWTQLTVSFNADTGLMSLYVDGILAGTGYHPAGESSPPSGPFVLGRYKAGDQLSASFDGAVGSTAVFPYAVAPAAPDATGLIRSGVNGNTCVDDAGFGRADGTPIQVWGCHGDTSQQFAYGSDGSVRVLDGCMQPVNGGRDNFVKIEYHSCNGTMTQKWLPLANNTLYHPDSGRCLDLTGWDAGNGNQLQLYDCHWRESQQWYSDLVRTAVLPAPPTS